MFKANAWNLLIQLISMRMNEMTNTQRKPKVTQTNTIISQYPLRNAKPEPMRTTK